jgi:hypothetical protein
MRLLIRCPLHQSAARRTLDSHWKSRVPNPGVSQVGKNDNGAMEDFPEHLRCCLNDAKIRGCTVENSYPYVLRVETFSAEDATRLRVCCALFGILTRVSSHDSLVVLIIDE